MAVFFKILFCKVYQWFEPDAASKRMAAIRAIGLLTFFYVANVVSLFWIISHFAKGKNVVWEGDFASVIFLILFTVVFVLLYNTYIQQDKYLLLSKEFSKNKYIFGFKPSSFTLVYLICSAVFFVISLVIKSRY
jgi:hypothetical protein